ncbi:hypothetical protein SOVF_157310, partial [Spinacia oleracea]
ILKMNMKIDLLGLRPNKKGITFCRI